MRKKKVRLLKLHRETVRLLQDPELKEPLGGDSHSPCWTEPDCITWCSPGNYTDSRVPC